MKRLITLPIIALIIIAVLLTTTTYAAISTNQTLSSSGNITVSPNIAIYSDASCTTPLSSFSWGSITPGSSSSQTIYIKNTGSGVSLTLSMQTPTWTPTAAGNYITITWTPTSQTIAPGASTKAIITLSVSQNIVEIQNFNAQISISGSA